MIAGMETGRGPPTDLGTASQHLPRLSLGFWEPLRVTKAPVVIEFPVMPHSGCASEIYRVKSWAMSGT